MPNLPEGTYDLKVCHKVCPVSLSTQQILKSCVFLMGSGDMHEPHGNQTAFN